MKDEKTGVWGFVAFDLRDRLAKEFPKMYDGLNSLKGYSQEDIKALYSSLHKNREIIP